MILVAVTMQTTVCSVSLMPPTAVVTVSLVVHRETGSFPMELLFLVFLIMFLALQTTSTEAEDKVFYAFFDSTLHQKEDVLAVNCWGTPSMPTSVSNISGQNLKSL